MTMFSSLRTFGRITEEGGEGASYAIFRVIVPYFLFWLQTPRPPPRRAAGPGGALPFNNNVKSTPS